MQQPEGFLFHQSSALKIISCPNTAQPQDGNSSFSNKKLPGGSGASWELLPDLCCSPGAPGRHNPAPGEVRLVPGGAQGGEDSMGPDQA